MTVTTPYDSVSRYRISGFYREESGLSGLPQHFLLLSSVVVPRKGFSSPVSDVLGGGIVLGPPVLPEVSRPCPRRYTRGHGGPCVSVETSLGRGWSAGGGRRTTTDLRTRSGDLGPHVSDSSRPEPGKYNSCDSGSFDSGGLGVDGTTALDPSPRHPSRNSPSPHHRAPRTPNPTSSTINRYLFPGTRLGPRRTGLLGTTGVTGFRALLWSPPHTLSLG